MRITGKYSSKISTLCDVKILQLKQAIVEAGKLKQEERDNIRIYITKFKKFRHFFRSSLSDEKTIEMFL